MLLKATDGLRGTVYDLDTNRRVPKVIELNEELGYVKAYRVVEQDDEHPEREQISRDDAGEPEWYEAAGRFKFMPATRREASRRITLGAPRCARCRSPLTLPGGELCPRCKAADMGQRNRFIIEKLATPLFDCKCEVCSKLAVWSVADEVEVTPIKSGGYLWDQGMTVGRRFFCNDHYEPGRLLDHRGDVIMDFRYAGPDTFRRDPEGSESNGNN